MKNLLARKFTLSIILLSSLVTLVGAGWQIYRLYLQELQELQQRFEQIHLSHEPSVVLGLWLTNEELVRQELNGILRFPDIVAARIEKEDGGVIEAGAAPDEQAFSQDYPLSFVYKNEAVYLGKLTVIASLQGPRQRLLQDAMLVLGTQALNIFMLAIFILFLFFRLIGRHLGQMSDYAQGLDLTRINKPLELHRQGKGEKDELDRLVDSINAMKDFLAANLAEVKRINVRLEEEVRQHKQVEVEKKSLQRQLLQTQKMEAIGTLAGGIAHDFNNILTPLLGYCEMAEMQAADDVRLSRYLRKIHSAGERAKDLVQQILAFSRQHERSFQPVLIRSVVEEALKLLRASLPSTIRMDTQLLSRSSVSADPTQIHQLMMNLCANAGHAMAKQGGILSVLLEDREIEAEQPLFNSVLKPGDYVCLTVQDTGDGIEPPVMARIFDPFFTTKEQGKGTGMGLSVAHGVVQRHGGYIDVDNVETGGARFRVFFPITAEAGVDMAASTPSSPRGSEHILLVDDEQSLLDVGGEMLNALGYRVTRMSNSKAAWDLFQQHPDNFDLVITDMTMPEMTGDRLVKKIIGLRPDFPVILCTGYSLRLDEESLDALEIRELLYKPFSQAQIGQAVRRALGVSAD